MLEVDNTEVFPNYFSSMFLWNVDEPGPSSWQNVIERRLDFTYDTLSRAIGIAI